MVLTKELVCVSHQGWASRDLSVCLLVPTIITPSPLILDIANIYIVNYCTHGEKDFVLYSHGSFNRRDEKLGSDGEVGVGAFSFMAFPPFFLTKRDGRISTITKIPSFFRKIRLLIYLAMKVLSKDALVWV